MFDIITFGSASWDIFLKSKYFRVSKAKRFITGKGICFNLGSKIETEDIYSFIGGGGTNTAATFRNQGFSTAYCGMVGNDLAGQEIISSLDERGISTSLISKTGLKPTNHSVILKPGSGQDRTILVYRGASELLSRIPLHYPKQPAERL